VTDLVQVERAALQALVKLWKLYWEDVSTFDSDYPNRSPYGQIAWVDVTRLDDAAEACSQYEDHLAQVLGPKVTDT